MANKVGRPALGITKKVSITLPENLWRELHTIQDSTDQPLSKVLRDIIEDFCKIPYVEPEAIKEKTEPTQITIVKYANDGKLHLQKTNYKTYCGSQITQNTLTKSMILEEMEDKKICKNCLRLLK